jgi:hypothetical protein
MGLAPLKEEVIHLIKAEAVEKDLRMDLILAIIYTESSGNSFAMRYERNFSYYFKAEQFAKKFGQSKETEEALQRFSYGLMQIMGATARGIGFQGHLMELLDPAINLKWACKYLKNIADEYLLLEDQLACYNGGPRAVLSKVTSFNRQYRNQEYVNKVLRLLDNGRILEKMS